MTDSNTTEPRPKGWYWAKYLDDWVPAYWDGECWNSNHFYRQGGDLQGIEIGKPCLYEEPPTNPMDWHEARELVRKVYPSAWCGPSGIWSANNAEAELIGISEGRTVSHKAACWLDAARRVRRETP